MLALTQSLRHPQPAEKMIEVFLRHRDASLDRLLAIMRILHLHRLGVQSISMGENLVRVLSLIIGSYEVKHNN